MVRKAAKDIATAAYKWARQAYYETHEKSIKVIKPWNPRNAPAAYMKAERTIVTFWVEQEELLLDRIFPRDSPREAH